MNKLETQQRRATPRFRLQNPLRLHACTLPLVVEPTGKSRVVEGHVQNISSGGLCLLARQRLKVSEMLFGEIAVPGTRASIPTLLQVRWLRKDSAGRRYRAGLHFVLQASIASAVRAPTKIAELPASGDGARRI